MPDAMKSVYFREELDPRVAEALETITLGHISEKNTQASLDRLAAITMPVTSAATVRYIAKRPAWLRLATAVSLTLCVLWCGAQTNAWGQVVADFQQSKAHVVSDSHGGTDLGDVTPGAPLRFVLMIHVFSLSAGLLAMMVAWMFQVASWSWHLLSSSRPITQTYWSRRAIGLGVLLYLSGILMGCVWSHAAWGVLWQWDPREGLALLTLAVAYIWSFSISTETVDQSDATVLFRHTIIASIAFWCIALMLVLGGIYASDSKSIGSPSNMPGMIVLAALINISGICGSRILVLKK